MANLKTLIIFVLLISQTSFARAPLCHQLFSEPYEKIPGLHEVLVSPGSPEVIARVTKLAKQLVIENRSVLSESAYGEFYSHLSENAKFSLKFRHVENQSEAFPTFNFEINVTLPKDDVRTFYFEIRSNGKVAFLNRTWMYRINESSNVKNYKAVYLEGTKLKSVDQGEVITNGFPEKMVLSRNMSGKERNRWVNGEPYIPSVWFGNRVHFMPHESRFDASWEPYYVQISKNDLLDFYHRGELEINIYEVAERMDLSKVDVKVNFEMVFMGEQGISNLAPYMRTQLADQNK